MGHEEGVALGRRLDSGQTVHLPQRERMLVEHAGSALELLQGKWKVHLLFLMARGVHRHCKLLEGLRAASKKMMTDTLRTLERDGLVRREIFAEVPLRVEYSLTPLGWSITEPLMALAEWDETNQEEVERARLGYGGGDDRGRRERDDSLVVPAQAPVSGLRSGTALELVTAPPESAVAETPTLVVFFSARSGSSRRAEGFLATVLQRRQNHETFRLVRVDADERPDLVERFQVEEIPTLVVVTGGSVRGRLSTPSGCPEISQLLSPWLK
jgi:DNA-binding HxlR family transcriptional regulator